MTRYFVNKNYKKRGGVRDFVHGGTLTTLFSFPYNDTTVIYDHHRYKTIVNRMAYVELVIAGYQDNSEICKFIRNIWLLLRMLLYLGGEELDTSCRFFVTLLRFLRRQESSKCCIAHLFRVKCMYFYKYGQYSFHFIWIFYRLMVSFKDFSEWSVKYSTFHLDGDSLSRPLRRLTYEYRKKGFDWFRNKNQNIGIFLTQAQPVESRNEENDWMKLKLTESGSRSIILALGRK